VPLIGFDDHFGLFFVGGTLAGLYTEEHLKLLSVVASQLAAFFSKLRLVEVLRARSLELEAVNRAKDDFLATLSHELRTPLNAIVGWASLLQTDCSMTQQSRGSRGYPSQRQAPGKIDR
jgi:signal transduction histidine kinase